MGVKGKANVAERLGHAATDYVLRQWARGDLNASDALDRVRELGGTITAGQYRMMRDADAGTLVGE